MTHESSALPIAPGFPGIPPRWTSSAKDGVGTALGSVSRVWFTHSHGILNEVYYSRVDQACIRDLGLIVTDGREFFSEEKRHTKTRIEYLAEGVPAYRIVNSCLQNRYTIEKEIFADPTRDVVLQQIDFRPQASSAADYKLYALLAPHLANHGSDNTAWVGEYKGTPLVVCRARRHGAGTGLFARLAEPVGRLRRLLGRLAGPLAQQADDLVPRASRAWQRRAGWRNLS